MLRMILRRVLLAAVLAAAAAVAGCSSRQLSDVKPGMMFTDVEHIMGDPDAVEHGDLINADKTTYVYPEGRVYFEKLIVVKVEPAGERPTITERVEQDRGRP